MKQSTGTVRLIAFGCVLIGILPAFGCGSKQGSSASNETSTAVTQEEGKKQAAGQEAQYRQKMQQGQGH